MGKMDFIVAFAGQCPLIGRRRRSGDETELSVDISENRNLLLLVVDMRNLLLKFCLESQYLTAPDRPSTCV